jgi:hypothetical protein
VMSTGSHTAEVTPLDVNRVYRRPPRMDLLGEIVDAYNELRDQERADELHTAIAKRVGTSRATVSRRLKDARELHLLKEEQ